MGTDRNRSRAPSTLSRGLLRCRQPVRVLAGSADACFDMHNPKIHIEALVLCFGSAAQQYCRTPVSMGGERVASYFAERRGFVMSS